MTRPALVARMAAVALGLLAGPAAAAEITPQTQAVNKLIADGWQKAGIKSPSAKANDYEFLRRVFIDLIGRIPTTEEVLDFEADRGANKRGRLVHRLMHETKYQPKVLGRTVALDGKTVLTFDYADEFAQHWANIWTVWLMTRTGHPLYREQMRTWLEIEFSNNTGYKDMVVKLLTAKGKSNENGAVNFIIHHLGETNPAEKQAEFGKFDAVPITSRVTRLFLGLQTQCAQCHDHPFNKEWVQGDFWGVNAFFRQTERDKTPSTLIDRQMMANPTQVALGDVTSANAESIIFYERRDGKLMATKPNFLKDYAVAVNNENQNKLLAKTGGKTRREQLAEYVVKHDQFGKAYVNRIWGHLFGRGLNAEPTVDDFGTNNEVAHPELLDRLSTDFAQYGYDPKMLLEWICNSDAYSLSHVALKDNADSKFDPYFARMPLKAMSPEVLFESLMTATKAETADLDTRKKLRDDWMSKLVRNFGDDEGNEITFNGTVVQALLMMNGRELNGEIGRGGPNNPVKKIIEKHVKNGGVSAKAIVDDLFLATVNRHPTAQELEKILALQTRGAIVEGEKPAPSASTKPDPKKPAPPTKKGPPPPNPAGGPRAILPTAPTDQAFYQDLFWALLNTNEFMLNH